MSNPRDLVTYFILTSVRLAARHARRSSSLATADENTPAPLANTNTNVSTGITTTSSTPNPTQIHPPNPTPAEETRARKSILDLVSQLEHSVQEQTSIAAAEAQKRLTAEAALKTHEIEKQDFEEQVDSVLIEMAEMGREALTAKKKIELLTRDDDDDDDDDTTDSSQPHNRFRRPSQWSLQLPSQTTQSDKLHQYHSNLTDLLSSLHVSIDKIQDEFHKNSNSLLLEKENLRKALKEAEEVGKEKEVVKLKVESLEGMEEEIKGMKNDAR